MSELHIFGYFDSRRGERPAYDPGLGVPCPVCVRLLGDRALTTISLMAEGAGRSYFFRAHKQCWDGASEAEKSRIEGALIDGTSDA